jgi:hypothetical protein
MIQTEWQQLLNALHKSGMSGSVISERTTGEMHA